MEPVPRKKTRRGLKRGWVFLLLLLAMAVAGTGAFLLKKPVVPELPETVQQPLLLSGEVESIASVRLQSRTGEEYTLVRGADGMRLAGRESMALRTETVDEMLDVLTALNAESIVLDTASQAVSLPDFGLEPARTRVEITYLDGSRRALLVGEKTPEEIPQRYCMMEGDPHIYSVLSVHTDVFFREEKYLRAFEQPSLRGDLLDRVDVTGSVTFSMAYTPSGWMMEAPYRYPLSSLRTDALLANIEGMAFAACLGTEEEVSLADYGLEHPALTVTLTQPATVLTGETEEGKQVSLDIPAVRYTLLIGSETGASGVYVGWNGAVYEASNFLLGFWKNLNAEDMLLRSPVNLLVNNLSSFTLTVGEGVKEYRVSMVESVTANNQIATDEYGRVLYDAAVRRAGEEKDMDAALFLNWYTDWAALAPAGWLPEGYAPQGTPRAEVVLKNETLTRVIAFYPFDSLHSAMAVDGVCRFYVANDRLASLLKAP